MKCLKFLITALLLCVIVSLSAQINQTVVYDFTNNAWGIKTLTPADPTFETGKKTYINGDKSFTINARGGRSFYYDNDCLRMDKAGNKLTLPAFDFAVDKIEVIGHSKAASYPNADINIQVGGNAVSTAVAGLTGSHIFEIAPEYQAAGNTYDIVIGEGGGTYSSVVYITYIKVYPAASENALILKAPVFDNGSGVYTEPVTVAISSPTTEYEGVENVVYYYTTDGYEPDAECEEIENGTITISESCTLKVVLEFTYEGQTYTSESTRAEYIISTNVAYVKATNITAGYYLIAAEGSLALPFKNGVLPTKKTTVANGCIIDAAHYAYHIEDKDQNGNIVEGEFYIKDANGLYLTVYMSNTDEIKSTTTSDMAAWNITIENNCAKIRKDGYILVYKNNAIVAIKEENATATEVYPVLYTQAKTICRITDGDEINYDEVKDCKYVYYDRIFENTDWQPWYMPFDVELEDIENKLDVACLNDVHQFDDNMDGEIDRTELEAIPLVEGTLLANYPYIVKAKVAGKKNFVFEDVTIKPFENNFIDCSSVTTKYTFLGSNNKIHNNGYYKLTSNNLVPLSDDVVTLSPNRWYLSVVARSPSYKAPAYIRLYILGEQNNNNETTAIDNLDCENREVKVVYDLQGRVVENPTKGI